MKLKPKLTHVYQQTTKLTKRSNPKENTNSTASNGYKTDVTL